MKTKLFSTLAAATLLPGALMAQADDQRPNIILFLVDDMGWQETSVPFYSETTPLNQRYRTPNMERMAARGVKFTNAYACAISSPSRCSLMTGMNAARHRVTNWTLHYNTKTDAASSAIVPPEWSYNGIQPATTTLARDLKNTTLVTPLPQILRDNGYCTIHCGKAHFGAIGTSSEDPLKMGFEVNIAGGANGAPASYLAENEYGAGPMHVAGLEKYYKQGVFLTEALTLEAIEAMKQPIAEGRPFYLYMSHYAIHTPYDADSRFTGNYANRTDPMLHTQLNQSEINHAALVEGMDKSLGDLLDFLDQHPDVARRTIVLFMSDNGGQGVAPRQGQHNRDQNWPARGGKGSAYEGGVHEPMMVMWPGVARKGATNNNRVLIEDFFPSILEMAGVEQYSTVQTVDGKSFVEVLRNPSLQRDRVCIWHFPNLWGETQNRAEGYGAYSAIMRGDYHLIYFWETQERRLYNIREDIGEQHDLAASQPDMVDALSRELTDSLRAMDAQRPTLKATGQLIPWPEDAKVQFSAGDLIPVSATPLRYSDGDTYYYYRVQNARPTPTYWTQGWHNGAPAIQCTTQQRTDSDRDCQLFYLLPGSDNRHFRLYTCAGEAVHYTAGRTGSAWNGGNIQANTTAPFLQYGGTGEPAELQLMKTAQDNYYGVVADGDLMNDRGTANGAAANMKWVVNTYSGNNYSDTGSRYLFTLIEEVPTAVASVSVTPAPSALYSVSGLRVGQPGGKTPGVYIHKQGGLVRKTLVGGSAR